MELVSSAQSICCLFYLLLPSFLPSLPSSLFMQNSLIPEFCPFSFPPSPSSPSLLLLLLLPPGSNLHSGVGSLCIPCGGGFPSLKGTPPPLPPTVAGKKRRSEGGRRGKIPSPDHVGHLPSLGPKICCIF